MSLWQRAWRAPQRIWLRRALFQIHVWSGIALGLYVVMLSITGSVLVYRNELDRYLATPRPAFVAGKPALPREQLRAAAERQFPGWTITRVGERISRRSPVIEVWAEKDGIKKERLFNPYTGEDLAMQSPRASFN